MSKVDKDLCIACGVCFGVHADLFALGVDGKAEAIKQPETPEELAAFQEAMANCPVSAISETKIIQMTPPIDGVEAPVNTEQTAPTQNIQEDIEEPMKMAA